MNSRLPDDRRGRLNRAIRDALRDLNVQLALFGQRVSGHLDLKGADLQCLDLIDARGPLSPSTLARLAGLHPATMTGVIDRLERNGWIIRERDPADRRGVQLRSVRDRRADVLRLLSGMGGRVAEICSGYSADELDVIAGFLRRTAEAARASAADLDAS